MAKRGPRYTLLPRSRTDPVEREDSRRVDAPPARSASGQESGAVKRTRGRPKENRGTVVITLRLPPDVVEAADAIVATSGHVYRDRSEFFRQTISEAVSGVSRRSIESPLEGVDRGRMLEAEQAAQSSRRVMYDAEGRAYVFFLADEAPAEPTKRKPRRKVVAA